MVGQAPERNQENVEMILKIVGSDYLPTEKAKKMEKDHDSTETEGENSNKTSLL